ncbi:MAG: hypothetical protein AAF242_04610 [Bacteroidota bacterium]
MHPHGTTNLKSKAFQVIGFFAVLGLMALLVLKFNDVNKQEEYSGVLQTEESEEVSLFESSAGIELLSQNYQATISEQAMTFMLPTSPKSWDFSWEESANITLKDDEVVVEEAFQDMDLRIYQSPGKDLSYDIILEPYADPGKIHFDVGDYEDAYIDPSGRFHVINEEMHIQHSPPYAYQEIDGALQEVESRFVFTDGVLSFEVGAYDEGHALVIDPTVSMMMLFAACPNVDYNVVANKQMITLSSTLSFGGGNFAAFTDGTGGGQNALWWSNNQNIINQEFLRMQFPSPTTLVGIEITGDGTMLDNNATYRIEGSNDGNNWSDITGTQTFSSSNSAPAYGASSNSWKFPISGNTTAYNYYRIFGLSAQTVFSWTSEIWFASIPANQSVLTNINCNDNSTAFDVIDDYISFTLDPCGGTGNYTVTASGTTIAAGGGAQGASATGAFGAPTTFRLPDGSVGNGDVTITISGFTDNMDLMEVITDPGSCLATCDNGTSVYETGNRQSLITVTTTTALTSGNPQQLVDGNMDLEGNGVRRTNGDITFSNNAMFWQFALSDSIKYTAFTLFTEGSIYLDNAFVGTIQGSYDETNWTNLTGTDTLLMPTGGTVYDIPLTKNLSAYLFYRMVGTSGRIDDDEWLSEITGLTEADAKIRDIQCNAGPTLFDVSDDYIIFELDPDGTAGTYNLLVDGYVPSPSTGTFGTSTQFTLPAGSAGNGDINFTIQDISNACLIEGTITDPGDCLPGPCPGPDWNTILANKQMINLSASVAVDGDPNVLLDLNTTQQNFHYEDVPIQDLEVLRVTFPGSEVLTGLEFQIGGSYMFNTGATVKVQGSVNGTSWVDMTPVATNTSPSLEISGNTYTKNRGLGDNHPGVLSAATFTERLFWENTTSFKYYRILGVAGNTNQNPWVYELYLETSAGAEVSNLGCINAGTITDFSDDQLTFDLNPMHGSGTYNVSVVGGGSISPTIGTYGQVTSFTLPPGSVGTGDVSLLITDTNVPCTIDVLVPNTENICIPGPCGGSDWNDPALKSTITGTYHVPGTFTQSEGSIAIFVDSDESNSVDSKSNNYANEVTFDLQFPEATVLTGIEVVVTSSPIVSATVVVEASNDGVNYVPLTGNLVFGTDFVLAPAQYGTSTLQGYAFPFPTNTTAYTYYRVFSIQMSTSFTGRRWNELYFNYNVFDEMLTNIAVGDNGTPGNFDDDLVSFDLNPTPGTGTYDLALQGAYSVSPGMGTFGQVTSFQTSAGAAGTGDLTVSLYDATENCLQNITIPNPDFSGATVEAIQNACASPTDNPLSSIRITADDALFVKAEFNVGTVYAGTGFASATDITNASSGFVLVNNLPNPQFDTYYTVRAYSSETLYRDYVVLVQPKVCSVADLQLSVSPATTDANAGEQLTYVVTLVNAGPDPAVNVGVRIDIPAGLELLTTSPTIGDYSPGTQLWTANLVPVGTHELTVTYRMK